MDSFALLESIPSIMSAIASVAAAIAAFASLKVSKEAKNVAEKSVIAKQHESAAFVLFKAVENIKKSTQDLCDFADEAFISWTREIEQYDERERGGSNPRPLRHVITDTSEMLVTHALGARKSHRVVRRLMYSLVRDGVVNLNDSEYKVLLKRADGAYSDFDKVFGKPSVDKSISESASFRWAFYQLSRRVNPVDWKRVWDDAWLEKGYLNQFKILYDKAKPNIVTSVKSLKSEKAKLAYSAFPLSSNLSLSLKYDHIIAIAEMLIDDCSLVLAEQFRDCSFTPDYIELIIYSIGVMYLTTRAIDDLYKYNMELND